jgi:ureidoglycolate dehydrogenase (NAD+)
MSLQPTHADSVLVPPARMREWAARCLAATGMPAADAAVVADSLVQTSLWGIDSHGVSLLPHYLERLLNGSVRARPDIRIVRTAPGTAIVEADQGQGIVVAHRAMAEAVRIARENGVGAVGVRNASHCGAVGLYSRVAARQGCVGVSFTHSNSIALAHGGERAFFGTNPISIAFPRERGEPVCLDMATTSIPWNRVRNAQREGHPLPPDTAADAQGLPTTDAQAAQTVMPLGGRDFGYKGYAMALIIDLLCGPLVGNGYGPHLTSMFGEVQRPQAIGSFFIAIDPERFAGGAALAAQVEAMARDLAAEPGSPLMPGDPEYAVAEQRGRDGVPVEPALHEMFREIGQRLGTGAPPA